ncbi:PREDICTED: alpha-N-acetylgalactosaminide alpha-2,6-sialyltransferase 2-like [Branchiostoma belcheri]|uniref:alpha-N-acetylgalactosaminide alpha-2,6-sialyltransferase n=1 Tax=Branchiostoma belcheri TaxID=7741 RepID=A0A6P4XL77_BRABE|nr:PREDICTED: alpha-N-acetylgalactosaminide alpha-2,6-sialyltransferase 2-like [Branchiostoma belcheri]XP_019617341.1 PREDICTED: alpha-N-acetylgalactosaminide alpha-2,6-sialyltransferase 2-like [Branchiostoma belcheri]
MGRFKWLFLLCLFITLGFVSFSYLRRSPAELGGASHWASSIYNNLPRYEVSRFKGVLDTIDRHNPTTTPEEARRSSETSENDSKAKVASTPSKKLVKQSVQRTTKQPQTVNITDSGKSQSSNENQTVLDVNNNKTGKDKPLIVDTGKNRTETTPKPAESGTPLPPTVPPAKRDPKWFLSDDTYTKSKCPSAMRKNPEKVPEGLKLIPDIPVLMWNEHINPEEYARLSQFKMNYGWKDLPYADIKNCLRHLNTSAHRYMFPGWTPDHAGCIRCAVVGNGGILRGSGKGKEIDGHDFVWRVNAAMTEGFEEDVGTRTSFYFHDINTMKNSQASARKFGYKHPPQDKDTIYTTISSGIRDYVYFDAAMSWKPVESGRDKSKAPPSQYGEKPANTKFRMLHPDFMRYLKYHWLDSPRRRGSNIYRPTTGGSMLLTALHVCDVTDVYGFITADHTKYNDHYYETDWHKVVFYANHDFQMEIEIWDKLDKAGIMNLYRGNITPAARKRKK